MIDWRETTIQAFEETILMDPRNLSSSFFILYFLLVLNQLSSLFQQNNICSSSLRRSMTDMTMTTKKRFCCWFTRLFIRTTSLLVCHSFRRRLQPIDKHCLHFRHTVVCSLEKDFDGKKHANFSSPRLSCLNNLHRKRKRLNGWAKTLKQWWWSSETTTSSSTTWRWVDHY